MGAHVKWFSMFRNKELFGKVTGGEGQNVLVDTKSFSDPTKDVTVKIPHDKVEVIDEKASLADLTPKPATHLATGTNPITYNVSANNGHNLGTKVGDLQPGEKVYPIGTNEKPYGVPVKTSSYAVKKHSPHQLGTVVSNKPDKGYITVEDATGKKHFPAKHYFAVKQHPGVDKALQDAKQKEHELLNNTSSGGHEDHKTWIDALGKHDDVPARPAKAEPANNEGQIGMHVDNMPGGKNDPNIFGEGYKKLDTLPQPSGYKKGDKVVLKDGRTGEFIGTGTHQTAEGPLKVTKWKINGQTTTVFGKDIHAVFRPETNVVTTHEATKPFGDEYKAVNFDIAKTPSETFKPGDKIVYGNGNHPGTVQQVHEHDIVVSKDDTTTSNYTSWIHLKPEQVNALYRKDGETAAPAAETPAPEPAAPEEPKIPSIANWTKIPGTQAGSNAGGIYTDENGKKFYVKLSQSDTHARNEVLADDLYKAAGIETTDLKLVDVGNGKLGTASAILEDSKPDLSSHLHDKKYLEKIQEGFAVDALLSNWDVAGAMFDNVISDKHGNPVRVDPGGALLFRAMGSPKGNLFKDTAGEWDTLRDGSNSESKALFGSMSNAQLIDSAKKVEALTPEKMNSIVDSLGFDEAQANELKTKLASRREDILARAAALAPAKQEDAPTEKEAPLDSVSPAEDLTPAGDQSIADKVAQQVADFAEKTDFTVYPDGTSFWAKDGNPLVTAALEHMGVAGNKPVEVSDEQFAQLKEDGHHVVYRGISGVIDGKTPEQAQQDIISSNSPLIGNGMFGGGIYFTNNPDAAKQYGHSGGSVSKFALTPDAKMVTMEDVAKIRDDIKAKLGDKMTPKVEAALSDLGYVAVMSGFDGIFAPGGNGSDNGATNFYTVLNRGTLAYTQNSIVPSKDLKFTADDLPWGSKQEKSFGKALPTGKPKTSDIQNPENTAPSAPAAPTQHETTEAPHEPIEDASAPKEYTTEELTSLPEGSKFAVPGETAFIQKNNGYWKTYLGGGAGMVTPVSAVADLIKSEHMLLDSSNAHTLDNPSVTGNELYDGLSQMNKNYLAEPVTIPYGSYGGNHPFDGFPGYNQTEAEQISQYIEDSNEVNDPLRSGIAGDIQSKALEIVGMDQVIKKSPLLKDVTVYRGVSADDALVHNLINNKMYSDFGYTSTSTDKNLSDSWVASTMDGTTPVMLHINLPAGYKAHQIDYNAVGQHSFTNEQEVILGRGGVFDVTHLEEYTNATGQKGYIATVSPILTEDNFDGEYHGHNTGEETTAGHPAGPQEPVSDAGGSGDVLQPGGSPEAPGAVPSPAAQEPAAKAEDKVTPAPAPAQGGETPSAPIADVPLIDKGKTVPDSAGNEVKVGAYVLHSKGKHGVGQVYQVLPSTGSVKIKYADGTQQTSGGHLVTVTDAPTQIPSAPAVDSLNAGDIHYDSATGKTYIGSKDGKPLTTGDKISYTKKGVTTEGTVKGIYPGEKTVKIEWNDGSKTGPKKASTLSKIEDTAVPAEHHDAPEQPQDEAPAAPEAAPQPEPVHEPTPEPVSVPEAPSDSAPEHLGGHKVADVSLKQLNDAPAGTEIHKPNGSLFFTKGEDGIWKTPKNNTYTSQQIKSVSDDLQGKLTLHDAGQADATPAPAPESVPDAPSADGINGKSLTNVSLEQLNAAPSGSKLSKENGSYWQKGDDGKWLFHHEDGSVQSGGTSSNGFKSLHEQDGYTFQLPSEEQAAPEAPASLDHLNGKSIKDASAEDIKALPVGSRITKDSGVYWEKTADNTWEAHYSTGAKIDSVSESNDEELHALSNIASTTFKISLPADNGGSEPTPQGFDHLVGTKWEDNGPSAADLPVGTTLEGDSGAKFTKHPDGSWQMQGYDSKLNNDQMDLGKGQGYKITSVGNDGAGAEAPSASEAPSVDPKNIKSPEDFQSLPVGSTVQVKNDEGGFGSFTKVSDNGWKSNKNGSNTYTDTQLADGDTYELLPSETPSEPSSMEDHVGKKLLDPTLPPASELPVGSVITSPSGTTSIKKTAGDEWTSQMSGKKYTNNDLVGLGHPGEWTLTSVGDAPAPATPTTSDPAMKAYDYDALDALPIGTKITNSDGYSLIKGGFGVYSKDWAPVDANGNHINFVDGSNYAVPGEIAKGSSAFGDGMWKVVPDGTSATAPTQTTPSGTKNLSTQELDSFPDGTKIADGYGNVFTKQYNDGWKGVSPEGQPYQFPDGSYTAYNSEMSKGHHWFPNAFWTINGDASAADSSTPAPEGKLMDTATASQYPIDTVIHGDNGVTLKKTATTWQATKDGQEFELPDGSYSAWDSEINQFFPGVKWSEEGAPAAPASVSGPVGSVSNPAKASGVTLTSQLLENYPVGTTLKKELSYQAPSQYYYVKQADGSWNYVKYTGNVKSNYSNSQLTNAYGHFAGSTASVSQPKPFVKSFISNTGEHGYVGDPVKYHTGNGVENGYVNSITDKGKVNVTLGSSKGYKAPSKLSLSDGYGLKGNAAASHAQANAGYIAPTSSNPAKNSLEFAGASPDDYNAQGITVGGATEAPSSGLGLVGGNGGVDKSNPLYGAPKPNPPAEPQIGKWDSADWLKKVEQRYLDNPNKAKSTLQQSLNWNTVQSALDGHSGSLDTLLSKKYIDEAQYQEAQAGIKAHEDANKSTLDKYAADKAGFDKNLQDWYAANPSANNYVEPSMPEVSKESFTGGEADWSKAHIGTYTADDALAAIKKDSATAVHGIGVATDSSQIEDLNVNLHRVLNTNGEEVIEARFKLTTAFGKEFADKLTAAGTDNSGQVFFPNYQYDTASGLMKDTATGYSSSVAYTSGKRFVYTDQATGAQVIFNRTSNPDAFSQHTLNNSVRVLMPKDSTSADYQKLLENMGITAKPASEGDIRVFGENKMISVFTGNHDVRSNLSGDARTNALKNIENKFGITPDDLSYSVDANGVPRFYLSDKAAEALQQYTDVSEFKHSIMIEPGSEDKPIDRLFNMISGPNPSILSTYNRWHNGIHKGGMSSSSDIASGSGDYAYTKPVHGGTHSSGNVIGLDAKSMLKRIDVYGNNMDKGDGERGAGAGKVHDLMKGQPYEIMWRESVPMAHWTYVNVSNSADRQELIDRLKDKGIMMINNIPVENFIITSSMPVPHSAAVLSGV